MLLRMHTSRPYLQERIFPVCRPSSWMMITTISLPQKMRTDLSLFLDTIEKELPGKELFKAMKLPRLNAEELVEKIRKIFQL